VSVKASQPRRRRYRGSFPRSAQARHGRHTAPSRIGPPPQGWNTLSTNSCLSEVEQEAKSLGDGVHLVDRHVTQFLTKPLKRNGSELVATGIGVVL